MKLFTTLITLLLTSSVFASTVLPKNMALAKSLATTEREEEIWELFWNGQELKPAQLKKDARADYRRINNEYRMAEMIEVESMNNLKLIHVVDSIEGNGCEHVYNMKGEYLNSMCGTESSEWSFRIR